jgi:photosystem II stability/assembly factor-like uncharacterized protein
MPRRFRTSLHASAVLFLVNGVAACGDDDASSSSSASAGSTSASGSAGPSTSSSSAVGQPTASGGGGDGGAGAGTGAGGASSAAEGSTSGGAGGSLPPLPECPEGSTPTLPDGAPVLTPGTWVEISPPGVPFDANATALTQGMTIDRCNPARIYVCVAGTNGGLHRSLDGGGSWAELGDFASCINVRVDPADADHLYVGSGVASGNDGFWVSHDGGETWAIPEGFHTAAAITGYDVYHVEPNPADFDHVLVSFHYKWEGYGEHAGVLESKDGGDSWTLHPPQDWGYGGGVFFLFDPAQGVGHPDTWLFGSQGSGFFRTTDAGASWTKVSDTVMTHGGAQVHHASNGRLYATTSQGVMRSDDDGATWTPLPTNGPTLGVISDGTRLYTGLHGGGPFRTALLSSDGEWSDFNAQTFFEGPFELAFDPTNGIVYSANIRGGVWALAVDP